MTSAIGSEFDLSFSQLVNRQRRIHHHDDSLIYPHGEEHGQTFHLRSGRDALTVVIQELSLGDHEVLLPAYLCPEVLKPFTDHHVPYSFYTVNDQLQIDISDVKKKMTERTKAIVIIHYFGFPQDMDTLREAVSDANIIIIEDYTHGFLSTFDDKPLGTFGDITFTSFRKYVPIPDGAIMTWKTNAYFDKKELSSRVRKNSTFAYTRLALLLAKHVHHKIPILPDKLFYRAFSSMDTLLTAIQKPRVMSKTSRRLLNTFNWHDIKKRRQDNFRYLLKNISDNSIIRPLFRHLPDSVCPLGFPVICNTTNDRDYLKKKLIENRIYPPVHWILPEDISRERFPDSHKISQRILTIPCDQRYNRDDMESISHVLNKFVKRNHPSL